MYCRDFYELINSVNKHHNHVNGTQRLGRYGTKISHNRWCIWLIKSLCQPLIVAGVWTQRVAGLLEQCWIYKENRGWWFSRLPSSKTHQKNKCFKNKSKKNRATNSSHFTETSTTVVFNSSQYHSSIIIIYTVSFLMLQWNPPTELNPLTPVYHIWHMQVFTSFYKLLQFFSPCK